jgi:hypothetical protein
MLFSVEDDPQEVNNLAGLPEMKEVEDRLRLRWDQQRYNTIVAIRAKTPKRSLR